MADVKASWPLFPRPTKHYDEKMMFDLVRGLEQLLTALRHPGEGRHSKLTLTHLPTEEAGLEPGALYALEEDGIVRISMANLARVGGFTITSSLGSVTVTIS